MRTNTLTGAHRTTQLLKRIHALTLFLSDNEDEAQKICVFLSHMEFLQIYTFRNGAESFDR